MAPKKGKGKKGDNEKKNALPNPEWADKSVEELREIVAQLESELEASRKARNLAQVEHGSLQSYYDVTREQIRELDMKIEKKDLEIENTEEDNSAQLKVYKQKSNFINYCHENKLKESTNNTDATIAAAAVEHERQIADLASEKKNKQNELHEIEAKNISEIKSLKQTHEDELSCIKDKLDSDIDAFQESCAKHNMELKHELDTRRSEELKAVDSRKQSHVENLTESHQLTCDDMRKYFEGVEKEQQITIEDLQAEIRKLKKSAKQNSSNSKDLKENNRDCGDELKVSSETVANLRAKTKDKDKNDASLKHTNLRLSIARNNIRDAQTRFCELEEKYARVEEERNNLRKKLDTTPSDTVCKINAEKKTILDSQLTKLSKNNEDLEQHLQHIINSAGLDEEKYNALLDNVNEFLRDCGKETEKLNLAIANATKSYNNELQSCCSLLKKHGVPQKDIDAINTLCDSPL